jgi:hypothetical protein
MDTKPSECFDGRMPGVQSPRSEVAFQIACKQQRKVHWCGIERTNGNEPIPEADKVTLENLTMDGGPGSET